MKAGARARSRAVYCVCRAPNGRKSGGGHGDERSGWEGELEERAEAGAGVGAYINGSSARGRAGAAGGSSEREREREQRARTGAAGADGSSERDREREQRAQTGARAAGADGAASGGGSWRGAHPMKRRMRSNAREWKRWAQGTLISASERRATILDGEKEASKSE